MERKRFLIRSFSLEDTPENKALLDAIENLRAKDRWTFSQINRVALAEYAQRHYPGNPQLALQHWTKGTEMPESIRQRNRDYKLYPKTKAEIEEERVQRLVERAKRLDAEKSLSRTGQ
jgi:hypothetical protein